MVMTASEKITMAREIITISETFLGGLCLLLEPEEVDWIPTLATNGERLYYNRAYLEDKSQEEVNYLVAHEVWHCVLGHVWRSEGRESEAWNIAADMHVNAVADTYSWAKRPQGAIVAPQAFLDLSTEEIYQELMRGAHEVGGSCSCRLEEGKNKGEGEGAPPPGEVQEEWRRATIAAAKGLEAGSLPGKLSELLPKAPRMAPSPEEVLARFLSETAKDDYSWVRPNRRWLSRGFYLPSMHSERVGRVAIALDTSGSIGQAAAARMCGWVQRVLDSQGVGEVDLLLCSQRIYFKRRLAAGESLPKEVKFDGGGTDFRPVFRELEDDPPVGLVYITDLYGEAPGFPPDYPVVWLVSSDREPPWGFRLAWKECE